MLRHGRLPAVSAEDNYDDFGAAVCSFLDLNGDGLREMLVGARNGDSSPPGTRTRIQRTIDETASGDVILVKAGTYRHESIRNGLLTGGDTTDALSEGGVGLKAEAGAVAWVLDSELQGGASFCCPVVDYSGDVRFFAGESLTLTTQSPIREGGTLLLSIQGPASVPVWIVGSLKCDGHFWAGFRGSVLVDLPPAVRFFAGTTDGGGSLQSSLALPPFSPQMESLTGFLQPLYREANGFVLGRGTMVVGLDSSF